VNAVERTSWTLLVGGLLAQLGAYLLAVLDRPDAPIVGWLAAIGIATSLAGSLAVGALRDGRLSGHAALATIALLVIPLAGFGAAMLLPPESATGPLLLGLPRRAALVLFGIGVFPLLILPFAYAHDRHAAPLDASALAELRDVAARLRAGRDHG
jgi:hypothetical protein